MRREGIITHFLSGNNRIGGRFIMCVCRVIYVSECFSAGEVWLDFGMSDRLLSLPGI